MNKTTSRFMLGLAIGLLAVSAQAGSLEPPPGPVSPTRPPDTCYDNFGNRFVDCGDGTIKDTETGLYWLKDANCFGTKTWADANKEAAELAHGQCGLTDGSLPGDWRLPTLEAVSPGLLWDGATGEFATIFGTSCATAPYVLNTAGNGCWSEGDPFSGVQSIFYWSATTYAGNPSLAWGAHVVGANAFPNGKTGVNDVWPVRGGP